LLIPKENTEFTEMFELESFLLKLSSLLCQRSFSLC
jgi:hypothetical protein